MTPLQSMNMTANGAEDWRATTHWVSLSQWVQEESHFSMDLGVLGRNHLTSPLAFPSSNCCSTTMSPRGTHFWGLCALFLSDNLDKRQSIEALRELLLSAWPFWVGLSQGGKQPGVNSLSFRIIINGGVPVN
jgi:hypothetical protein